MYKRIYFVLILAGLLCFETYGQNWSQHSLSSLNPYREIAAYGGMDRTTMISGHIRSQWSQFGGSPSTQYLGVHTPIYLWNGAIGLDVMNQTQGAISLKRMRFSYNHVSSLGFGYLSLGGRVGIIQGSLDGSKIITPEGEYGDGQINHNDPILANLIQNGITPIWEVSALVKGKTWTGGVSLSDLPVHRLSANDAQIAVHPQMNIFYQQYFSTSYNVDLQASAIFRTDFINVQSELSVLSKINGNVFGGLLLRGYSSSSLDAIGAIFGHNLNENLSMFYTYEFGVSELNAAHQGSHEILVKYRLDKLIGTGLPPKIIYNPRFL